MQELIRRYKNYRKRKYLSTQYHKKYAFVGIGNHSIDNLYPVLHYLKVSLKYIVTQSAKNAKRVDLSFPHSIGTSDLNRVLNDKEVAGIFICAHPSAHFDLVRQSLQAHKHVFVEKPPCAGIEELKQLIQAEQSSRGTCLVGLQKQYAPAYRQLKKRLSGHYTYHYRYLVGNYPEGDSLIDLFIHPLSLCSFLFSSVTAVNVACSGTRKAKTFFLQTQHADGAMGSIELSTDYSWQCATEELTVNTNDRVYKVVNTEELVYYPKAGTFLSIPKEKLRKTENATFVVEQRNNFSPILKNNQLYSSGYFHEIEHFIRLSETGKGNNLSDLASCVNAFSLIDTLRTHSDKPGLATYTNLPR